MKKSRNMKERIFALLLALTMITGLMPQNMMVARAAAGDPVKVEIQMLDSYDQSKLSQFKLEIERTDATEGKISIDEKDIDTKENKYLVELKQEGTYKYTATADGYVEKTGEIEVKETNEPVKIQMDLAAIETNQTSLSLKVGETGTLSVSNPVKGATYAWNTEKSSVATVSNGTVTATGKGSTNITVSYKDETRKILVKVSQYETKVELSVDPANGKDVTEVELKAKVTDGTNNVNEGSVTFKMGDSELGTSAVTNGEATYTYQAKDGQYLNGDVTFTATYNETTKYATSNDTATQKYASKKDIQVTASDEVKDGKIVFNGTASPTTFSLEVEGAEKRNLKYKSQNLAVATVDESTGEVTVLKPGDIEILVTAEATNDYNTSTYTFKAIAQRKVTLDNLDWQSVSKVYDSEGDISITGSVPASLQVGEKTASYKFTGSFADVNVGSNKDITLGKLAETTGDGDYYSLEWSDNYEVTGVGTITAREVTLDIVKDVRLSYGQDLKSIVEKGTDSAVTDLCGLSRLVMDVDLLKAIQGHIHLRLHS